ncbi:hypothetical protein [Vibrio vulnificus]|uniref:hypothetical protein n=1 Tax=Vibrio vulnificus TaxID=672 RepID=UPI001F1E1C59|nr:hypothetical protein [Vibrio vulnificus]
MVVLLVSLARRAYHFQQLASSSTPFHECRTYYLKSGTYKDKEIKLSSLKHEIIGLKISDDDAYRLIKHYDINDTQMVISRCSLNWKRAPKRLENGKFLEMINNQQIEIGLIEYNSTLSLECLNDAQPSSTTLIDDKITTIYHPTFGYLRHIEIIGLDQTTLTLQDLKWTTQ